MIDKLAQKFGIDPNDFWFKSVKAAFYGGISALVGYLTAVGVLTAGGAVDLQKLIALAQDPKTLTVAALAAFFNGAWVYVVKAGLIGKLVDALLSR